MNTTQTIQPNDKVKLQRRDGNKWIAHPDIFTVRAVNNLGAFVVHSPTDCVAEWLPFESNQSRLVKV